MQKLGERKHVNVSRWFNKDATVTDIGSKKVVTCMESDMVKNVLHILSDRYRRLPVTDREGNLKGMVASTDIIRELSGVGKKRKLELEVRIKDAMTRNVFTIDKNTKMNDAIEFFRKHRKGSYPITYRKKLAGTISEWDIVRQIRGNMGVRVSDLMIRKPLVAQDSHTILDVSKMLGMGGFRRLPVVRNGILVGIITPRDILSHLHMNNLSGKLREQKSSVKSIMTSRVYTVSPDDDAYEAVKIMIAKRIGGLPVVEDHELLGIITERDIVDVIEL